MRKSLMKKTVTGVLIMVIAIVGIIGWEMFGREQVLFTEVLVLNQDVEAYTTITKDLLALKKVYQPNKESYTKADIEKIVGKESTQFIPVGAELQERFFKDESLQVNKDKDEYVYSLSVNNLKSYPRSIAKGDKVQIFCMENKVIETTVLGLRDSSGNEVVQNDDRTVSTGQIASVEIKATSAECGVLSTLISNTEPLAITYN